LLDAASDGSFRVELSIPLIADLPLFYVFTCDHLTLFLLSEDLLDTLMVPALLCRFGSFIEIGSILLNKDFAIVCLEGVLALNLSGESV